MIVYNFATRPSIVQHRATSTSLEHWAAAKWGVWIVYLGLSFYFVIISIFFLWKFNSLSRDDAYMRHDLQYNLFMLWFVLYLAPNQFQDQNVYGLIVKWAHRNKFKWISKSTELIYLSCAKFLSFVEVSICRHCSVFLGPEPITNIHRGGNSGNQLIHICTR